MKITKENKSRDWELGIECIDCHSELIFDKNDLICTFYEEERNMFTTHLEYWVYHIICPICKYKIDIDRSSIHPVIRRSFEVKP